MNRRARRRAEQAHEGPQRGADGPNGPSVGEDAGDGPETGLTPLWGHCDLSTDTNVADLDIIAAADFFTRARDLGESPLRAVAMLLAADRATMRARRDVTERDRLGQMFAEPPLEYDASELRAGL